ncbi:MAG TPA: hypothetical protein VH327_07560 [Gammaproteobacteria bacterium]|jgi:hypothetical protein|nr:hypothetical protein [Gammaproteobacteria bacterium]
MAMNRVLNSIWAEISAWGSIVKTATNPYTPSPGSADDTSNNQGLAALASGSPFIVVNRSGVSPDVAVGTNLVDGANASPSAIEENNGAYQVVRQYGDIYLFNDGNVIAWGGNGKNFSFGNGYEENHAWANQACVYNNETFQIPLGAMSSFSPSTLPNGMFPDSSAAISDWEWLGGNVSKSWGNDYSYSYGRSYEWSGGPNNYVDAFGNTGAALTDVMQGKHCSFSYGNGYEEALIGWTPTSTWFHADDASSPYKSRVSDSWTSSNLGSSWTAANLLVSKAFGPTYDYHYGPTLSVQEGPSEEHVNGSSWSTVTGDSNETVNGNSSSTVNGNANDTINGDQTAMIKGTALEQHWGRKSEFFMGGKSEMSLAACDEINLAAKLEIVGGVATEIFLGAKLEVALGALMEIKVAGAFEVNNGAKIEITNGAKLEIDNAVEVEVTDLASVSSALVKIFAP